MSRENLCLGSESEILLYTLYQPMLRVRLIITFFRFLSHLPLTHPSLTLFSHT